MRRAAWGPPAHGHQRPSLHPALGHEGIMKEGESFRWLLEVMVLMVVITVLTGRSYGDSVAFTHGVFGHQRL